MNQFKKEIKEFAAANGVDMIGFASKDRFEGVDPRYNPFSIFPEAKTVIVLGRRITRGTLRGTEEGSNFFDYDLFGAKFLDDQFVAQSCYDVTRFLEDAGWEAVPIFPNPQEAYGMGVPVAEGRPEPNVAPDFQYAVVACGLGEVSMHGEILTKRFGPRQRFQMIITDAEIESDPILTESICNQCGACADVCPMLAIDKNKTNDLNICGKTMKVADINYNLCRQCKNGAKVNRLFSTAKPDRLAALCTRTCMCKLEESNNIENVFENSFRTSEAWGIDIYGKNVKVNG